MNKKEYLEFINYLKSLSEEDYKNFSKKITPTNLDVIGIRVPKLRQIAKTIDNKEDFLKLSIDSNIFEILMLHGLVLSYIKDFNKFSIYLKEFTKRVDNWAITDTSASSYKIFNKNKSEGFKLIKELIKSKYTYSKRMGYVLILDYYVKEEYLSDIFSLIKNEKTDEYYIKMAIAWLISVMYIKYKDETYDFLKDNKIDDFIFRKTISKINDSYRVSKEDKLKVKKLFKIDKM